MTVAEERRALEGVSTAIRKLTVRSTASPPATPPPAALAPVETPPQGPPAPGKPA